MPIVSPPLRQGAMANKPKKFLIGIDLDAIAIDLVRPWIKWHNDQCEELEHHLTVEHITEYKIEKFARKGIEMFNFFNNRDNYANCPVLPGAAEGLQALKEEGHDLVIATATGGQDADLKWHLVKKVAPWFHDNDIMVGYRKELLKFDVFLDDAPKNVVRYRNAWPQAKILTIEYPYNRDIKTLVDLYAQDYNNMGQAWSQICNYIHTQARGDQ